MQPILFFQPVLFAIFLWWFLTGLVFTLFNRPRAITLVGFGLITFVMGAAFGGIWLTRGESGSLAIYTSLACGMVIWGWQTASYYLGFITGPVSSFASEKVKGTQTIAGRFWAALKMGLWHEVTIIGFALLLAAITWAQPNRWGLWIYIAVWLMHSLAKLCIFFGVRNFRVEFMPEHMQPLTPLLKQDVENNRLLPLGIMLGMSFALMLIYHGIAPTTPADSRIGFLVLGATVGLGTVEILLLAMPISAMLWGWGVRTLPQHAGEG